MQNSIFLIKILNQDIIAAIAKQLHNGSIDPNSLKEHFGTEMDVYSTVNVFQGEDLFSKFPDAKAVEGQGKTVAGDTYVGVCPTHPGVRDFALEKVRNLIAEGVRGIWLDHLRYPTIWESQTHEIFDTCYCDRCLKLFSEEIDESIDGATLEDKVLLIDGSFYIEWLDFKIGQINSLVKSIKDEIVKSGKDIKLGIFVVPWEEKDYGSGMKRLLGQDLISLSGVADVISPMLYYKEIGESPEWIKEKISYYWDLGISVVPAISLANSSPDVLTELLNTMSVSASNGVIISRY
ncbi:hypothetical protein C4561_05775 [candidate division WWE3 bacterium]|uniref:DUF4015 domain-containing protein n=1 Tax=candidate division WWE3 bacterium TaxID=2053526 RepID=A0A3A4ZAF6_UNCKA|nr:MAG: hypothetical protein C4561_05775 [candidate division WWE3 bacterium]